VAEIRYPQALTEDALVEAATAVHAIIVRALGRISERVMAAAPDLRVVGRHGAGVENIDVDAATRRRIYVINTPEANSESVAEHTVCMMLALSKRLLPADSAVRRGDWQARNVYVGQELYGKTLGLIGFGRIGRRVAGICHSAFGMPVLYYDAVDQSAAARATDARRVSLDELLAAADTISVHVPLIPATHHLISAREFARMKPSAIFLNLARGPVVDEPALLAALQTGQISGAGLDVFAVEPATADNPLFALENVVVTPHNAALTHEALSRMAATVAQDTLRVLAGGTPEYWVNRWDQ
jgi:D-3-phosphoglycerate dehydrogenase